MAIDSAALAASTLAALEHQGLQHAVDVVKARLLKHSLCDEQGELKPFVELVLFEIRDIAKKSHLTTDDKVNMVKMALTVAGF